MTTFQIAISALLYSLGSVLPLGDRAHAVLLSDVLGWPQISAWQLVGIQAGILIALIGQLRHEAASSVSSLLRMTITFSRPRTVDDFLGLALVGSIIPLAVGKSLWSDGVLPELHPLFAAAGVLIVLSVVLVKSSQSGRKNRSMINWSFTDGLFVGLCSLVSFLPGGGRQEGALSGALLRNYDLASATRFVLLSLIPVSAMKFVDFMSATEGVAVAETISDKLSLGVGFTVGFFATWLATGAILTRITETSITRMAIYRVGLAITLAGFALRLRAL